jgi:hypothetical protein
LQREIETILQKITANTLRLTIASNFLKQKKLYQVISSPSVERLEVTGDIQLRLRTVATSPCSPPGSDTPCSFRRSPQEDRALHRGGHCGVDVRALWADCPLAQSFNDVVLPMQTDGLTFAKWIVGVKKAFFEDYSLQGGMMDSKEWGRARWSSRAMPKT